MIVPGPQNPPIIPVELTPMGRAESIGHMCGHSRILLLADTLVPRQAECGLAILPSMQRSI